MPITMPADQFAVWARMVAENHPWVKAIRTNADKDDTASPCYASRGRWSGLYFLMTGDEAYARRSFNTVATFSENFCKPTEAGNDTREHTIEQVMLLDWLRPALSPTEQQMFLDWMILTAEGCLEYGLRAVDSDQVSGTWGFFALLDTVCGTDFLTREVLDPGTGVWTPMGGLEATGCDRTTYRNCVRQYVEESAAGGQWIESQEYNLGTPALLYMAWQSLRTALAYDPLPEFAHWLPQTRLYHRHELIPGFTQAWQWGDVQENHALHWTNRDTTYAFLRAGDPVFESFAAEVDAVQGRVLPTGTVPKYPRYYYYANPYADRSQWRETTALMHCTEGTGHAYWRTGWDAEHRATHLHCPNFVADRFVDHWPNQFGNLRLARGGRFLLDQPISYSSPLTCVNGLLVVNSGPGREACGLTDAAFQPGVFGYASGTNCGMGPDIRSDYYDPPPTYLHENTRHVFELLDGDETVVVICDRVYTDDPRTQLKPSGSPAIARYPSGAQTRMAKALGLKDLLFHMPVEPTLAPDGRSFWWDVPETPWIVQVRQVLPTRSLAYTVIDECNPPLDVEAAERKWCVHASTPQTDDPLPSFELFLHVLVGGVNPSVVTVQPLETVTVSGVVLRRAAQPTVVVLFSAIPGPVVMFNEASLDVVRHARTIAETFSVSLPEAAKVYLVDLDPDAAWIATDSMGTPQIVSHGAVMELTCEAGLLTLYCNEVPPEPPTPPVLPDWHITEQSARRIVLER